MNSYIPTSYNIQTQYQTQSCNRPTKYFTRLIKRIYLLLSNKINQIQIKMKTKKKQQLNKDFPLNNYKKYKSQTKTNPLLTKLNHDAGYPQSILSQRPNSTQTKNYLQMNKKNLKNFFSDRLPAKDIGIFKESFTIDPSKMFEIRKKQYELKSATQQKLQQKLSETQNSSKLNNHKMRQNFHRNDKNYDFKMKLIGQNSLHISQPYQSNNFLKGTTSFIQKYHMITKKQAYSSVFGPETSAVSRKSARTTYFKANNMVRPFTYSTNREKKKMNFPTRSKQLQRQKFTQIIQKIDNYRQNLDPDNKFGIKPYIKPKRIQETDFIKTDLITWIRDTTKEYKNNSINFDRENLKDLEDICKIDNKFFQEMIQHKARRLQNRQFLVQNISMTKDQYKAVDKNNNQRSFDIKPRSNRLTDINQTQKINDALSISSHSETYSISSSQKSNRDDGLLENRPLSLVKRFIRALVDALFQARLFGIENKDNIYKAFWKNPEPFEKSGSYAFFKAIKRGDLDGIKKFLANDADYIYQRDHKGRSPLIYACMNNRTEVIEYILKCDINVNKKAFNKRTALYYAAKNKNVDVTKKLLQAGASPWSHKNCSYINLLNEVKNQKLKNLFKNAKKISISIKMTKGKTNKIKLWNHIKAKINQNQMFF